jgi:hypothetical protein
LYENGSSCTTQVSGSEISLTSVSWTKVRTDSTISLSDATDYMVCVKTASSGAAGSIANAKIIQTQSDAGGITYLETVQQLNNTLATDSDSTYTAQNYDNKFDDTNNWDGGTFAAYFETTIKTSNGSNAYYAIVESNGSEIAASEITATDTAYTRKRDATDIWSSLTDGGDTDVKLKNASTDTTSSASSWLVIVVSNLQIPESMLFAIPLVFFMPYIIKRWMKRKERLVYSVLTGSNPVTGSLES